MSKKKKDYSGIPKLTPLREWYLSKIERPVVSAFPVIMLVLYFAFFGYFAFFYDDYADIHPEEMIHLDSR